jgi:hypothetical protein
MFGLISLLVIVALIFGGFYYWARRQGLLTAGQATEEEHGTRRISLLTEAVAYIGAVLILAGGIAAVGQRMHSITPWGRVGIMAGAAVVFLLAGIIVRRIHEPAMQRLADVVWFLSVAAAGWAAGFAAHDVYGNAARVTALAVGTCITVYAAVLWLVRRHALENFALFAGLVIAAAAMAGSLPLRNTPLLALGTLAMFGYVTGVVVRYFHQSLGVPGALTIAGVLILGLAVISARLLRATHPPKPKQPGAEAPSHLPPPPKPEEPGAEKPSHQDLPKAS